MQTSEIYYHAPYRILLENLEFVEFNKINCEIYLDAAAIETHKNEEIKKINDVFKKSNIKKIAHGPFMDLNIGSFDPSVRQLSQKRYMQALDICKKLQAPNIVLHTGFHPVFYRRHIDEWMSRALKTMEPVVKMALKEKVRICIENSIDHSPEISIELVKKIGAFEVLACFDIAHCNVFTELPVMECFKQYPPEIIGEIHLSDNKGEFDDHLALGEGSINFKEFFDEINRLKIKPLITVEPHSMQDIPKSANYLSAI